MAAINDYSELVKVDKKLIIQEIEKANSLDIQKFIQTVNELKYFVNNSKKIKDKK